MKYKVEVNSEVGRYAIASKSLAQGEEIITELPFVVGPKFVTIPMCLGCYQPVTSEQLCSKCKWPVCSEICENNEAHKDECAVFSGAGVVFQPPEEEYTESPQYQCITPLRCLLAKDKNKERWENEIACMVSHCEKRKETEIWKMEEVNVVQFLRTKCKLSEKYSEELIHKICGILEVNSFEALTSEGYAIQGLYPQTAIMSHCCVANTIHSIDNLNNFKIQVRTTVPVEEGKELFASYIGSLLPTLRRRTGLLETKYFSCKCQRCADPTELGTHMSSLKCTQCDPGLILSTDPLDETAPWKCTHCDYGVNGTGIFRIYDAIQADIDRLEGMEFGPDKLQQTEQLMKQYKSVLHPRHAFNISLCHSLMQMYGKVDGYTLDMLPDIMLEHKSDLCKKIMDVLDIVEPGYTRIRGLTFYEWHVVEMLHARSQFQYKLLNVDQFKEKMRGVLRMLQDCKNILSLEPPNSQEGSLGQVAAMSVDQLSDSIDKVVPLSDE